MKMDPQERSAVERGKATAISSVLKIPEEDRGERGGGREREAVRGVLDEIGGNQDRRKRAGDSCAHVGNSVFPPSPRPTPQCPPLPQGPLYP